MKQCPQCQSIYANESYIYCLDDGAPLVLDTTTKYDRMAETLIINAPEAVKNSPRNIKVVRRQMVKENNWGACEIAYPQIQGLTNQYIQSRINTFLRKKFASIAGEKEEFEEYEPAVEQGISFGITLNDGQTLSLLAHEYLDVGGAHPAYGLYTFNIELASGYRYTYDDLFKPGSGYEYVIPALASEVARKQFEKDGGEFLAFDKKEDYDFYITKRNLVIANLYPYYALQSIEAPIKLSEIADIIHPEGPLYRLLKN